MLLRKFNAVVSLALFLFVVKCHGDDGSNAKTPITSKGTFMSDNKGESIVSKTSSSSTERSLQLLGAFKGLCPAAPKCGRRNRGTRIHRYRLGGTVCVPGCALPRARLTTVWRSFKCGACPKATKTTNAPTKAPVFTATSKAPVAPLTKAPMAASLQPPVSSAAPVRTPTVAPLSMPNLAPVMTPRPSTKPSAVPSVTPSAIPSVENSFNPSETHSVEPSAEPSVYPSDQPTIVPSISPSTTPSVTPSLEPSTIPSASPTERPSALPSNRPSAKPSFSPSNCPSAMPSQTPSMRPSATPSQTPTGRPSASPSNRPSSMPSAHPSRHPSSMPSQTPSQRPSVSHHPSSMPSQTPSQRPSVSTLPSTVPSAMPSVTGSVIVSEVFFQIYPGCHWIEIYNRNTDKVDLNGYKMTWNGGSASYTFQSGSSIPSKEYRLLGFSDNVKENCGVKIDFLMSGSTGFSSSDTMVLENSNQVKIDIVEYTSGTNEWPSIDGKEGIYQSMALKSVRYDGNVGSNWCASSNRWFGPSAESGSRGTPRRVNDCGIVRQPVHKDTGPMGIIITEIMVNPIADDDSTEWFEIYNASPDEVDMEGWKIGLESSDTGHTMGSFKIGSGEYKVLGRHSDIGSATADYVYGPTASNTAIPQALVSSTAKDGDTPVDDLQFRNEGDFLILVAKGGTWQDAVPFFQPDFPSNSGDADVGKSMQLSSLTLDNEDGSSWCQSTKAWSGAPPAAETINNASTGSEDQGSSILVAAASTGAATGVTAGPETDLAVGQRLHIGTVFTTVARDMGTPGKPNDCPSIPPPSDSAQFK